MCPDVDFLAQVFLSCYSAVCLSKPIRVSLAETILEFDENLNGVCFAAMAELCITMDPVCCSGEASDWTSHSTRAASQVGARTFSRCSLEG